MKDFTKQRPILFLAAVAAGFLFHSPAIPIPYIIGGILASFIAKTSSTRKLIDLRCGEM